MAYNLTLTNGQSLVTVPDGTTDSISTSITLVGKNFAGYGIFLNENFLKLLENFSNATAPVNPLKGQLWWNSAANLLQVNAGTPNSPIWKTVSSSTSSPTAPSAPTTGDLWWDSANGQLKVWSGSIWTLIGPNFTSQTGTSGPVAEIVTGTDSIQYVIVSYYVNNVRTAIMSRSATFTPSTPIPGFTTIKPGWNLANLPTNLRYWGIAEAAESLLIGGNPVSTEQFLRKDQPETTGNTITITNSAGLTVGINPSTIKMEIAGGAARVTSGPGQSLQLVAGTNIAANISPTTGLMTVIGDPTAALGVATKQYVDTSISTVGGSYLRKDINDSTPNTLTITNAAGLTVGTNPNTVSLQIAGGAARVTSSAGQNLQLVVGSTVAANVNANTGRITVIADPTDNLGIATKQYVDNAVGSSGIYLRKDINDTTNNTITIANNNGLTVGVGSSTVKLEVVGGVSRVTSAAGQNLSLVVGSNVGATINSATGLMTVIGDPTAPLGVATKQYVDTAVGSISVSGLLARNGSNTITGNILPDANNTRNLGAAGTRFATIFATTFNGTATTAQYADLAERFESDAYYEPGTVVELGGEKEITAAKQELTESVFGVISTRAAYLMNAGAGEDRTHPPVAMNGRVPVRVIGRVRKGDRLVSAGNGLARAATRQEITPFNVIGRSLEDKNTDGEGTVEAIVLLNT
ncbi:MAG: hypothetical protein N2235_02980 [Fischerella sp.]|nr:hypothetical protein [Fischerella sp.]